MKILNLIFITFLLFGCYNSTHHEYVSLEFNSNNSYISVIEGNIPIILIVSHSGKIHPKGIKKRKDNKEKTCYFNNNNDLYTDDIAFKLSDIMDKKYKKRPYIIINNIHRKYFDANRSTRCSYDDDRLYVVHKDFRQKIVDTISKVKLKFGDGVLIDIHGQHTHEGDVFIGTNKGNTIKREIEDFIIDSFSKKGYDVPLDPRWRGGMIVSDYGLKRGYYGYPGVAWDHQINAFQIEIDKRYRYPDKYDGNAVRYRFCWDFADIVMDILKKIEIN